MHKLESSQDTLEIHQYIINLLIWLPGELTMELKAFIILLQFLTLQIHRNFCINLKNINLDNSRIESIEHITMNPMDMEYEEYYGDYIDSDVDSEDYDHVGDINDFQIVSLAKFNHCFLAHYLDK